VVAKHAGYAIPILVTLLLALLDMFDGYIGWGTPGVLLWLLCAYFAVRVLLGIIRRRLKTPKTVLFGLFWCLTVAISNEYFGNFIDRERVLVATSAISKFDLNNPPRPLTRQASRAQFEGHVRSECKWMCFLVNRGIEFNLIAINSGEFKVLIRQRRMSWQLYSSRAKSWSYGDL
jgi:hypothetical protein